jgi:hypothetical protein
MKAEILSMLKHRPLRRDLAANPSAPGADAFARSFRDGKSTLVIVAGVFVRNPGEPGESFYFEFRDKPEEAKEWRDAIQANLDAFPAPVSPVLAEIAAVRAEIQAEMEGGLPL